MISSHTVQQLSYPIMCLSISTVETAVSEALERQETPKSSSNCHLSDTSSFLTDALLMSELDRLRVPVTLPQEAPSLSPCDDWKTAQCVLGFLAPPVSVNRAQGKQHSKSWRSGASCLLFLSVSELNNTQGSEESFKKVVLLHLFPHCY